jgi:mono/diheme cytochrome c family protein
MNRRVVGLHTQGHSQRLGYTQRLRFSLLALLAIVLGGRWGGASDPPGPAATPPSPADLHAQAQTILKAACYRCHGQDGAAEGGFNYVLDTEKLIARRKLVPGDPAKSTLLRRIENGSMPPPGEPGLSDEQVKLLRQWITAGPHLPARTARQPITAAQVNTLILADLDSLDRRTRRFTRYFSLVPLWNAELSDDELQTYRAAVSKLVNSLSWHPQLRSPVPIDPQRLLLRIDLRWYMWDANTWHRLANDYPYAVVDDSSTSRALAVATGTRLPVLRADWFTATASRGQLYHDLLQLPPSLTELERLLRVDVLQNIQQERVMRAGFNGSGVSKNNRILERHDSAHGYYWRTYDFEAVPQALGLGAVEEPDRRNIFAFPLGPGAGTSVFQHAGGEAIFSLPNGLQGYMIADANNNRIDKGPIAIVSDPRRPDRAVETAVSCMSCHVQGIIPKADQIRDHIASNPSILSRRDAELVRALYPPKEAFLAAQAADSKRYLEAVAKTGTRQDKYEPVTVTALRYEADLDLATAAAELGLTPDALRQAIAQSPALARNLGALQLPGGTVARTVWVQTFPLVVNQLRLGTLLAPGSFPVNLAEAGGDDDPLARLDAQVNAIAFAPDGKLAVFAGADRSVRLWDVPTARERRTLTGHTGSLWSVAVSPNGKLAVSGGMDGSVRVWNLATGESLKQLSEHLSMVSALAISPDHNRLLSASHDQALILWDLTTGQELRRWENATKQPTAALFLPDGKQVLLADRQLRLLDLTDGRFIRQFHGHTQLHTALAISTDGQRAVSGSDDGTARLWDIASGKQLQSFQGHTAPVLAVALSADGKWLATGSADRTVRLWSVATGAQLGQFNQHADSVLQVTFVGGNRATLSGSRDGRVLLWDLAKFAAAAPQP